MVRPPRNACAPVVQAAPFQVRGAKGKGSKGTLTGVPLQKLPNTQGDDEEAIMYRTLVWRLDFQARQDKSHRVPNVERNSFR